jgi:small GTP-binding protein
MEESDESVKVVVLGDAAVGKSSLVTRFIDNQFMDHQPSTVGAAYFSKTLSLDNGRKVKLEIWDTAGQERYRSLAPMYYKGARAALVVFDLTKKESLSSTKGWVAELKRHADPSLIIGIVGNKCDRPDLEEVSEEDAVRFMEEAGASFYLQTSAKTAFNVNIAFDRLASEVIRASGSSSKPASDLVSLIQAERDARAKREGCC